MNKILYQEVDELTVFRSKAANQFGMSKHIQKFLFGFADEYLNVVDADPDDILNPR